MSGLKPLLRGSHLRVEVVAVARQFSQFPVHASALAFGLAAFFSELGLGIPR